MFNLFLYIYIVDLSILKQVFNSIIYQKYN